MIFFPESFFSIDGNLLNHAFFIGQTPGKSGGLEIGIRLIRTRLDHSENAKNRRPTMQEQAKPTAHSDSSLAMCVVLA